MAKSPNNFEVHATHIHLPHGLKKDPARFFARAKRHTLGTHYVLSLVLSGDTFARRINKEYRKKEYAPNVLSYPISATEGEIILNLRKAEREARALHTSLETRLMALFVHGCLHLKGFDHGIKMEAREKEILKRLGFAT